MKPRIAMLAYACDPAGSGEHWLGWGWAVQAAGTHEVHLFTPPKARAAIEAAAPPLGIVPHFLELPGGVRTLSEQLGAAGLWLRKIIWAKRAAQAVAKLHAHTPLALVHQTTFHTFRVPFYAASLGLPSVWGPIAGGESSPPGFDQLLGSVARAERTRARANALWLRWPAVQRALRDTRAIFVSNRTTRDFLPTSCHPRCTIVPPNALREEDAAAPLLLPRSTPGPLRLLYVGNCVATRCLPLVFRALSLPESGDARLTIVGTGPALSEWRAAARKLGLQARVEFAGQVARDALPALYASADALVFPALRDSGGSALLEAMSKGLPVICFAWAGPDEMVDAVCGVKIPVTDPADVVREVAAAVHRLHHEPARRAQLGANAAERARRDFTWAAKRAVLEATYERLLRQP
jgi:glycosyltransferase involved in cell wall biosynthesis